MTTKKKVDAYGEELWDLYKGNAKYEIIERDDGFVTAGVFGQLYLAPYKDWPEIEKKALRSAKGRILDVGCGAGRHSIYLQKKGFEVVGMDNSPLAIKISRLRGLKKARVLPIERIDAFKAGSFDTVLMLGNNFGLFAGPDKARKLLKKIHRITSPDAVIIAGTKDVYKTTSKDHLDYHRFNRRRGRMPGQLRIRVRHRKTIGPWFDYLMVSKKEMEEILAGTGWEAKKFISPKGDSQYVALIEKVKN